MVKTDKVSNRRILILNFILAKWKVFLTSFILIMGCIYYHVPAWTILKEIPPLDTLEKQKKPQNNSNKMI